MVELFLRLTLASMITAILLTGCDEEPKAGEGLKIAEERIEPGEAEQAQEFINFLQKQSQELFPTGKMLRFAHPKSVACVDATFEVEADLPPELAFGIFQPGAKYQTKVRFGNNRFFEDNEKDIRGMSIKLMNVGQPTLVDDQGQQNQDFVLVSNTILVAGKPQTFMRLLQASMEGGIFAFFFNPFDLHLKEFRNALKARAHHTNHLDIGYWSATPYAFGPGQAVKYETMPCAGSVSDVMPDPLTPNYLREGIKKRLANGQACFDFKVQFQKDPVLMPIEDASVEWDTALSPFQKVATIKIPQQDFDNESAYSACESLAFDPWHAVEAQKPLGGINRARKIIYAEMAKFRNTKNQGQ